jgi:hypothetical protein
VQVSALALMAAGCGQYAGVHAPATLPTQTVARQGPDGDIPDPSAPGAVHGDARVVQKVAHSHGKSASPDHGRGSRSGGHHGKGAGSGSSLSRIGRTFAQRNSVCSRQGSRF